MSVTNRFESMGRGHQAALACLIIMIAAIVLLLLAETAVRLASWYKHREQAFRIEDVYHVDEATQLRLPKPGYRSERLTINALGFRGPLIPEQKPEGVTRIAFLGGSTTFCADVSGDDKTWPFLAMQTLAETYPDRRFDYLNASVPGFTAASSLARFQIQVAALEPDVVVIYHATNDLSKNSRKAAEAQGFDAPRGDQDFPWIADHSLLAYLVVKNLRVRARQRAASDPERKYDIDTDAATEPFADDLAALVSAVREAGAKPVLATFSTRLRADQSDEDKIASAVTSLYYMPYMTPDGLIAGFEAYNRAIRAMDQARVADIADAIPGDAVHFVDSVHLTDAGARAMADAIAPTLIETVR